MKIQWGGEGVGINKRVCFALNLKTGEGKKIGVCNIEEKQIFASFDRGDLQQLLDWKAAAGQTHPVVTTFVL